MDQYCGLRAHLHRAFFGDLKTPSHNSLALSGASMTILHCAVAFKGAWKTPSQKRFGVFTSPLANMG